ncbi:MAG: hypothetical protein ABFD79_18200, partial [Phycisphaerales bacterium]
MLHALHGFNHFKSFGGNQYCNFGGAVKYNSPTGFGNWSENPKITGSLQNHIEVILSDSRFRLPVNSTYRANWRRANFSNPPAEPSVESVYYIGTYPNGSLQRYKEGGNWEGVSDSEIPSWNDYPHVSDELWGENEAGIELFLKVHGAYDWYFDMEHRYTPTNMMRNALRDSVDPYIVSNPPSESALWAQWDLIPDGGTLRRGLRYTCGRYNPFMAANHAGSDLDFRKEPWSPNFISPYGFAMNRYGSYDMPCKWFGARTNTIPAINKFDEQFMDLTPFTNQGIQWLAEHPYKKGIVVHNSGISYYAKQDITNITDPPASNNQYEKIPIDTFTTPGNRENGEIVENWNPNVQVGWMLHLCDSTNDKISYDPAKMKSVYILDVKVIETENKTYITVSDTINKGTVNNSNYFVKAGWSRDICTRHDGCGATWSYDETRTITYKIHYQCQPELLLDLKDLLDFAIYKDVSLSRDVVSIVSNGTDGSGGKYGTVSVGKAISICQALVNKWISLYGNKPNEAADLIHWSDGSILVNGQYPEDENAYHVGSLFRGSNFQAGTGIFTPSYFMVINAYYYACCIRYYWPDAVKNAPKTVLQKVAVTEQKQIYAKSCASGESPDDIEEYGPLVFDQSCSVGSLVLNNRIVSRDAETLKTHYSYVPLSTSGIWYKCQPTNLYPYAVHTGKGGLVGTPHTTVSGDAYMNMALASSGENVVMILDWEDVPESFFTENFFHIDVPRVLQLDNNPPRPDPPVHHYDPYTKLKYILPYDLLSVEQQDAVKQWSLDLFGEGYEYQAGEQAYVNMNGKKQLFTAKNYIAQSTIMPMNDPDNWTWEMPWVELHLYGESCLCKDYEASDPVKYRLVCKEDGTLSTEYTPERKKDLLLKTIELDIKEAVLSGSPATILNSIEYEIWVQDHNPPYPKDKLLLYNGVLYRVIADPVVTNINSAPDVNTVDYIKCKLIIPIADVSDWYVGDMLEILGTPFLNRVKPIISKGSTFV